MGVDQRRPVLRPGTVSTCVRGPVSPSRARGRTTRLIRRRPGLSRYGFLVRGVDATCVILANVGYTIFRQSELEWIPRGDDDPRRIAGLSDALTHSRANIWRYPPGSRGKRHLDRAQEEVFVVLDGTLTVDLGEPAERHVVTRGSVVVVQPETILQLRNAGAEELVLFIYGAPPVRGQGEFFPDVP
jgi:mannose-6-phosphate isomerase-like protein (cupin superfamily)